VRAAVIGGSLGGLTAALLLHELGVEVDPELIFGLRAPGA
jgi:2-polyprenyl-6-methoxyphenol hydroxylase-like FAD-dependent oxidoreductase